VRRALAATALSVGLAIAGCGDDDPEETTPPTVSIPAITSPLPATTAAPATTTTPTGPTDSGTGGTRAPGGGSPPGGGNPPGGTDRRQPDSAANDLPPPAGSPQEAFEKQCQQNPAACG
jgi:hypothetical protein